MEESGFLELKYVGIGETTMPRRGMVMLFVPEDHFDEFVRKKDKSEVPIVPVPVPFPLEGLYARRLTQLAASGRDPDGDVFNGFAQVARLRPKGIYLLPAEKGVTGVLRIETATAGETDRPVDIRYTLIDAVLAGLPIFVDEHLLAGILSQVKVEARFRDAASEDSDAVEAAAGDSGHPEEVKSLDGYLTGRIREKSDPLTEDPAIRKQLLEYDEEELLQFIDLSLESGAYEWTDFLKLILMLKKGGRS